MSRDGGNHNTIESCAADRQHELSRTIVQWKILALPVRRTSLQCCLIAAIEFTVHLAAKMFASAAVGV
jgi:hypothetical protein